MKNAPSDIPESAVATVPCDTASQRVTGAFILWLAGMTILAGGFRLYHLDAASFWVDELNTIRVCAELSDTHKSKVFGYLPTAVGLWLHGANPSELGSTAYETWRAKGVTEWSSRIASAIIGILCIPVLGLASCRILGRRVAGLLALFLAVAPWHVYWSQASRFYSQQFLFYTLALIWYYRATHERSRGRFVAAMIAMVLAFLSQPPALIICTVFAADWLIGAVRRKPVRLDWFGWAAAAVALGTCAAILALDIRNAPDDWAKFSGDLYQAPATMILGAVYMIGPAVVLVAALTAWRMAKDGQRILRYLILTAVVPPILYAVISTRSYVGLRYAFICFYGWLALAALGTDRLYVVLRHQCGRALAAAPIGLVLIAMLLMDYGYFTSGVGYHTRWRDAFAYVKDHRAAGDRVLCQHPMIGQYYLEDITVEKLPKGADALSTSVHPAWIVSESEDAIRGRVLSWVGEAAVLQAVFDIRVVQPYSSVRVYRYEPPSP
ncbi:MAG: glycosyltransferase family 39 protein [Planctomycetes bacterium]|nr:glycosyltransferase family 39 protein [Planctomycetota bacterium]